MLKFLCLILLVTTALANSKISVSCPEGEVEFEGECHQELANEFCEPCGENMECDSKNNCVCIKGFVRYSDEEKMTDLCAFQLPASCRTTEDCGTNADCNSEGMCVCIDTYEKILSKDNAPAYCVKSDGVDREEVIASSNFECDINYNKCSDQCCGPQSQCQGNECVCADGYNIVMISDKAVDCKLKSEETTPKTSKTIKEEETTASGIVDEITQKSSTSGQVENDESTLATYTLNAKDPEYNDQEQTSPRGEPKGDPDRNINEAKLTKVEESKQGSDQEEESSQTIKDVQAQVFGNVKETDLEDNKGTEFPDGNFNAVTEEPKQDEESENENEQNHTPKVSQEEHHNSELEKAQLKVSRLVKNGVENQESENLKKTDSEGNQGKEFQNENGKTVTTEPKLGDESNHNQHLIPTTGHDLDNFEEVNETADEFGQLKHNGQEVTEKIENVQNTNLENKQGNDFHDENEQALGVDEDANKVTESTTEEQQHIPPISQEQQHIDEESKQVDIPQHKKQDLDKVNQKIIEKDAVQEEHHNQDVQNLEPGNQYVVESTTEEVERRHTEQAKELQSIHQDIGENSVIETSSKDSKSEQKAGNLIGTQNDGTHTKGALLENQERHKNYESNQKKIEIITTPDTQTKQAEEVTDSHEQYQGAESRLVPNIIQVNDPNVQPEQHIEDSTQKEHTEETTTQAEHSVEISSQGDHASEKPSDVEYIQDEQSTDESNTTEHGNKASGEEENLDAENKNKGAETRQEQYVEDSLKTEHTDKIPIQEEHSVDESSQADHETEKLSDGEHIVKKSIQKDHNIDDNIINGHEPKPEGPEEEVHHQDELEAKNFTQEKEQSDTEMHNPEIFDQKGHEIKKPNHGNNYAEIEVTESGQEDQQLQLSNQEKMGFDKSHTKDLELEQSSQEERNVEDNFPKTQQDKKSSEEDNLEDHGDDNSGRFKQFNQEKHEAKNSIENVKQSDPVEHPEKYDGKVTSREEHHIKENTHTTENPAEAVDEIVTHSQEPSVEESTHTTEKFDREGDEIDTVSQVTANNNKTERPDQEGLGVDKSSQENLSEENESKEQESDQQEPPFKLDAEKSSEKEHQDEYSTQKTHNVDVYIQGEHEAEQPSDDEHHGGNFILEEQVTETSDQIDQQTSHEQQLDKTPSNDTKYVEEKSGKIANQEMPAKDEQNQNEDKKLNDIHENDQGNKPVEDSTHDREFDSSTNSKQLIKGKEETTQDKEALVYNGNQGEHHTPDVEEAQIHTNVVDTGNEGKVQTVEASDEEEQNVQQSIQEQEEVDKSDGREHKAKGSSQERNSQEEQQVNKSKQETPNVEQSNQEEHESKKTSSEDILPQDILHQVDETNKEEIENPIKIETNDEDPNQKEHQSQDSGQTELNIEGDNPEKHNAEKASLDGNHMDKSSQGRDHVENSTVEKHHTDNSSQEQQPIVKSTQEINHIEEDNDIKHESENTTTKIQPIHVVESDQERHQVEKLKNSQKENVKPQGEREAANSTLEDHQITERSNEEQQFKDSSTEEPNIGKDIQNVQETENSRLEEDHAEQSSQKLNKTDKSIQNVKGSSQNEQENNHTDESNEEKSGQSELHVRESVQDKHKVELSTQIPGKPTREGPDVEDSKEEEIETKTSSPEEQHNEESSQETHKVEDSSQRELEAQTPVEKERQDEQNSQEVNHFDDNSQEVPEVDTTSEEEHHAEGSTEATHHIVENKQKEQEIKNSSPEERQVEKNSQEGNLVEKSVKDNAKPSLLELFNFGDNPKEKNSNAITQVAVQPPFVDLGIFNSGDNSKQKTPNSSTPPAAQPPSTELFDVGDNPKIKTHDPRTPADSFLDLYNFEKFCLEAGNSCHKLCCGSNTICDANQNCQCLRGYLESYTRIMKTKSCSPPISKSSISLNYLAIGIFCMITALVVLFVKCCRSPKSN